MSKHLKDIPIPLIWLSSRCRWDMHPIPSMLATFPEDAVSSVNDARGMKSIRLDAGAVLTGVVRADPLERPYFTVLEIVRGGSGNDGRICGDSTPWPPVAPRTVFALAQLADLPPQNAAIPETGRFRCDVQPGGALNIYALGGDGRDWQHIPLPSPVRMDAGVNVLGFHLVRMSSDRIGYAVCCSNETYKRQFGWTTAPCHRAVYAADGIDPTVLDGRKRSSGFGRLGPQEHLVCGNGTDSPIKRHGEGGHLSLGTDALCNVLAQCITTIRESPVSRSERVRMLLVDRHQHPPPPYLSRCPRSRMEEPSLVE